MVYQNQSGSAFASNNLSAYGKQPRILSFQLKIITPQIKYLRLSLIDVGFIFRPGA